MKLKRIVLSIVAGTALLVPAALAGQNQLTPVVRASTLKNKITTVKSYTNPTLYNKNGKELGSQDRINFKKPISFMGNLLLFRDPGSMLLLILMGCHKLLLMVKPMQI